MQEKNSTIEYVALTVNASFWTNHNVTLHKKFETRQQSIDYLYWRNTQYLFYDQLMPFEIYDGQVVLDYGCGPGDDLAGVVEFSEPRHIIGMEISPTSLAEAELRLKLHDPASIEFILIADGRDTIPLDDDSIDSIICTGVFHHTANPDQILTEFHRILKPGGRVRMMVYNYNSLWVHLYVAYQRRIIDGIDSDVSLEEAFKRSTDGPECPISRFQEKKSFLKYLESKGFQSAYLGAAISLKELTMLPSRYQALTNKQLPAVHREFLKSLSFDQYGRPMHDGDVAGIDSIYELKKAENCQ